MAGSEVSLIPRLFSCPMEDDDSTSDGGLVWWQRRRPRSSRRRWAPAGSESRAPSASRGCRWWRPPFHGFTDEQVQGRAGGFFLGPFVSREATSRGQEEAEEAPGHQGAMPPSSFLSLHGLLQDLGEFSSSLYFAFIEKHT